MNFFVFMPRSWRLPSLTGFVALLFLGFGFLAITGGKTSDAVESLAVGGILAVITIVLVHRRQRDPGAGAPRRRAWHAIAPRPGDERE